jgi:hypothetical protein
MKINEWHSTDGSKYHIIGGVLSILLLIWGDRLCNVCNYISVIIGVIIYSCFVFYQVYDVDKDNQQKGWDFLEFGIGGLIGIIVSILINVVISWGI